MKVFISWSGDRSLAIARALREWLPRVIQVIDPWMSDSDTDKGIRWEQRIGKELEQTRFGIFCLTPENLDSRWLNFEAGAIAKTVDNTYVCTYLRDLKATDIEGPLSQFNHTNSDKEDTRKLIRTVNRALDAHALESDILDEAFDVWWPRLEEELSHLPAPGQATPPRKLNDMVEEILGLVRAQARKGALSIPPPVTLRFPSTLDWSFEDAQVIAEHYLSILEDFPNKAEREYAEEIRTHPGAALRALRQIRLAKEAHHLRKPRPLATGNWICKNCQSPITELPFEPRDPDEVLCRNCHMQNRPARSDRGNFGGAERARNDSELESKADQNENPNS